MLLTSTADFTNYTVGAKASRLQELQQTGFVTPNFVVLPAEYLQNLAQHNLKKDITAALPAQLYAVRSAALQEDTNNSSMAGQFLTKLAVTPAALAEAVAAVHEDAQNKLSAPAPDFSIIVQEYIAAECAGVLFTRNPLGGREMILEYAQGQPAQVVSGGAAQSLALFTAPQNQRLPFLSDLYEHGKKMEQLYDFPQDIEWAYAAGQLYVLQTRPITNLARDEYQSYQYLDAALPTGDFYYEQTAVTEALARPTPLALSLLEILYQRGGPVDSVYAAQGVTYTPCQQFVIIGNQLYVDKQAETQTLFPSLGYLKNKSSQPKSESLKGTWTALKNTRNLSKVTTMLQPDDYQHLITELKKPISPEESLDRALANYLKKYALIFKINLSAQVALARLEIQAGSTQTAQELLAQNQSTLQIPLTAKELSADLLGNSVSIDDQSVFVAGDLNQPVDNQKAASATDETASLAVVVNNWMLARELGRWLTVRLLSDIRTAVQNRVATDNLPDQELVYFATIEELQNTLPSTTELAERRQQYQDAAKFTFPTQLTSFALQTAPTATVVLSPGRALGTLCTVTDIATTIGPKILLVDKLSPELTSYFQQVEGIVCRHGGLLSHLAIMAREAGLPVVLSEAAEQFVQQVVTIDSSSSTVVTLAK